MCPFIFFSWQPCVEDKEEDDPTGVGRARTGTQHDIGY